MVNALEKVPIAEPNRIVSKLPPISTTGDLIMSHYIRRKLNLQKLRDLEGDFASFDLTEDSVNNIYIGPQGTLLEAINSVNERYRLNIGVTKNFTFKPGVYADIKKAYTNHVLRFDMRPRGLQSIFNRIDDYRWRAQGFKASLTNIELQMLNLRSTGMVWQDNTEQLGDELDRAKSIVNKSLRVCKEMFPNITVLPRILLHNRGDGRTGGYRHNGEREIFPNNVHDTENTTATTDPILVFYIHIKNLAMKIHYITPDGVNSQNTIDIGDVVVASGTYLYPLISRNWGRDEPRTDANNVRNHVYFLEAINIESFGINRHPYISSSTDKYSWETGNYQGHNLSICTGNMGPELKNSIVNLQVEAHIMHMYNWLSNYYIPQTNPLNRFWMMKMMGNDRSIEDIYSKMGNRFGTMSKTSMECTLGYKISEAIREDSRGHVQNFGYMYDSTDDIVNERKIKYLNAIKLKDLPCINCNLSGKCYQEDNIRLIMKETSYTPMEEGVIGMFVELFELEKEKVPSHRRYRYVNTHYVEELVMLAHNSDQIDVEYDLFSMSHYISKYVLREIKKEVVISWDNLIYRRYMRTLMGFHENTLGDLYNKAVNEVIIFDWDIGKLIDYDKKIASLSTIELQQKQMEHLAEEITTEEEQVTMTAEEATLRWASHLGGATNL